jgi:hypothetical protein
MIAQLVGFQRKKMRRHPRSTPTALYTTNCFVPGLMQSSPLFSFSNPGPGQVSRGAALPHPTDLACSSPLPPPDDLVRRITFPRCYTHFAQLDSPRSNPGGLFMPLIPASQLDDLIILACCAGALLATTGLLWVAGWWASLRTGESAATNQTDPETSSTNPLLDSQQITSAGQPAHAKAA